MNIKKVFVSTSLLVTVITSGLSIGHSVAEAAASLHNGWPTIRSGSSNGYVGALQADMWSSGYQSTVGTVNQSYGAGTVAAVKAYQSSKGLGADGVTGSGTWNRLDVDTYKEGNTAWTYLGASGTYETYYTLINTGTGSTLEYYLQYKSNGAVVKGGKVYNK